MIREGYATWGIRHLLHAKWSVYNGEMGKRVRQRGCYSLEEGYSPACGAMMALGVPPSIPDTTLIHAFSCSCNSVLLLEYLQVYVYGSMPG